MRAALLSLVCAACGFHVPSNAPSDANSDAVDAPPDGPRVCSALEVVAGGDHTCARMSDGTLYCWGRGASGELGVSPISTRCTIGATPYVCSAVPLHVAVPPAVSLGLGSYHTCASTTAGTYCWGLNGYGGYGDASTTSMATPTKITQRDGAGQVDAGRYHTCSIGVNGLSCSGGNISGEVGNNAVVMQTTATIVMTGVTKFALGDYISCAIDGSQTISCWGRNAYKEIDPSQQNRLVPTSITAITGVVDVAAGLDHICAVLADHTAQCWGSNTRGQLGNSMTATQAQPPTAVGVPDLAAVSADRDHTCVLDHSGQVFCFGEGYTVAPMQITLPRPAISLATGSLHDCAVVDDHTVWCWGNEDYGQLGNGVASQTREMTPQRAQICPS